MTRRTLKEPTGCHSRKGRGLLQAGKGISLKSLEARSSVGRKEETRTKDEGGMAGVHGINFYKTSETYRSKKKHVGKFGGETHGAKVGKRC